MKKRRSLVLTLALLAGCENDKIRTANAALDQQECTAKSGVLLSVQRYDYAATCFRLDSVIPLIGRRTPLQQP